jgi:hypothetical protein
MRIKGRTYVAYKQGSKKLCDEVADQLRNRGYLVSVRLTHPMKMRDRYTVYVVPDAKLGRRS